MQAFPFQFDAMASRCEMTFFAPDEATAETCAQAAIAEVRRIETKYSRYQAASIVGQINAGAGQHWVECDQETMSLFAYAETLFHASQGLFDITSGVLRRVWNFSEARLPTADALQSALALVGWDQVERDGLQVRLPRAGMEIDFGGFGKEYAADQAAAVLQTMGVESGFVSLAGDIHVIGPRPGGEPWGIGIRHPRDSSRVLASIPVYQGGLATSGDYERYFELDGQRYCHVLDCKTGYPVTHWQSVSVLARTALAAGSYATITMLQQAKGLDFLEHAQVVYLAIDAQGTPHRKDFRPTTAN